MGYCPSLLGWGTGLAACSFKFERSKLSRFTGELLKRNEIHMTAPPMTRFCCLFSSTRYLNVWAPYRINHGPRLTHAASISYFQTPQHLSIMKDLPPGFNYVTLQPSRDKRWLYCALVCRSKTVVASSDGKGKSKEKFTTTTSPPRVFLTRVEFDQKKLVCDAFQSIKVFKKNSIFQILR